MSRVLGTAIYHAYRQGGILHVTADGIKPYIQTKVTIEQLPILIYPPSLALFFDTPIIASPALVPFFIEKAFASYPKSAPSVIIQDASGLHAVDIEERTEPDTTMIMMMDVGSSYCVFQQIGVERYVIAKCDAILPAIYYKVYGPSTKDDCDNFVREHSRGARSVRMKKDTFKAWINAQPVGERKLIVTGEVSTKKDTVVELAPVVPGGFNPTIRLLRVDVVSATPTKLPFETKAVRYEETPPRADYNTVTVWCEDESVDLKVEIIQ